MAVMGIIKGGTGGGSIKDMIREKALNGGFSTSYTLSPFNDRTEKVTGKLSVDTDKKICYLYCDFTMKTTASSASWVGLISFSSQVSSSYRPIDFENNSVNSFELINDDTAGITQKRCCYIQNYQNASYIGTGYGTTFNDDEHHIVYAMWSYL